MIKAFHLKVNTEEYKVTFFELLKLLQLKFFKSLKKGHEQIKLKIEIIRNILLYQNLGHLVWQWNIPTDIQQIWWWPSVAKIDDEPYFLQKK